MGRTLPLLQGRRFCATGGPLKGAPTPTPAPTCGQTFKLSDGRVIGFDEYGDQNGRTTLLYFHGYPSSRVEARALHRLAHAHSVRVLSLDRPGYGLSSPQAKRTLMDWPRDVEAFARGKGIERFAVMGTSGGGPFAVACAYALPSEMLSGVGLFASGPPWEAGRGLMTRPRRALSVLANRSPGALSALTSLLLALTQWFLRTKYATSRIDAWLTLLNSQAKDKAEEQLKANPSFTPSLVTGPDDRPVQEQREELITLLLTEAFAQGPDAAVQEARILSAADWGFRLEDVMFGGGDRRIKIWHGVKDTNAPIEAIRFLAEKLPNAELREFADDTHYTMGDHIEAAFLDLVGERAGAEKGNPKKRQAHSTEE